MDRVLRSARVFLHDGWIDLQRISLTIDMAALQFVEFGAVGRLLLLIEGASRHGARVTITPPASNLRNKEHALVLGDLVSLTPQKMQRERRRIAYAVIARRRVSNFLSNLGFFSAAQLSLISNENDRPRLGIDNSVWSSTIGDLLAEASTINLAAASPLLYPEHRRQSAAILPWEWVDPGGTDAQNDWGERFIDFLHDRDLVMTRRDAESVVTTVLRELIDNVHEHAGVQESTAIRPPTALIGGLTLRSARYAAWRKHDALYASDRLFNDWIAGRESPLVRIFVGDSGSGIPATLGEAYRRQSATRENKRGSFSKDIILFSFEPIASRHGDDRPRGLGLAAVGRFVRGYAGRVAIRSANAAAGYWYPRVVPVPFGEDRLAYTPGTTVEVTLGLTLSARAEDELTRVRPDEALLAPLVIVPMWIEHVDRLESKVMERVRGAQTQPIVVVLGTGWPSDRRVRTDCALLFRRVAKAIEGTAALALVLPEASKVDVRTTFSPLDEVEETAEDRSRAWRLDEWTPPILVVAADGSPTWTGSSREIRRLLYSALEGNLVDLDAAIRGLRHRSSARDYLLVQRDWFIVESLGNARLRMTLEAIEDRIAKHVESALASRLGFQ